MKFGTVILTWLLLIVPVLGDTKEPISVKASLTSTQIKIVVKNESNKPQWIVDSLEPDSDSVPYFSWVKFKRKDGTLIQNRFFEDGRWNPIMPSSFLSSDDDEEPMIKIEAGSCISVVFSPSRFLARAPIECSAGFDSMKFMCRIYTEPYREYVAAETDWVKVDAVALWRQSRPRNSDQELADDLR